VVGIVQGIGAVAGTAAAVGLPLLWTLHVSQGREVKRLREWASRAPEAAPQPAATVRPRYRGIGARPVAVAVAGLLILVGVTRLIGDDGADQSARRDASPTKPKRPRPVVEPGDVTVSVLNGTTVPGLAAALREKAAAAGFKKGTINTFSNQQLTESVVQYAPGHQAEAKAVGRRFEISQREPVTAEARALAPDATVIVIAGADKARDA
jgi:hypothetical protein